MEGREGMDVRSDGGRTTAMPVGPYLVMFVSSKARAQFRRAMHRHNIVPTLDTVIAPYLFLL
jgi:hypothetical protein